MARACTPANGSHIPTATVDSFLELLLDVDLLVLGGHDSGLHLKLLGLLNQLVEHLPTARQLLGLGALVVASASKFLALHFYVDDALLACSLVHFLVRETGVPSSCIIIFIESEFLLVEIKAHLFGSLLAACKLLSLR